MAYSHRSLRNRPSLRIKPGDLILNRQNDAMLLQIITAPSIHAGEAMAVTQSASELHVASQQTVSRTRKARFAVLPPSRKPARLNSHATFGCKPTPSSAICFAESR